MSSPTTTVHRTRIGYSVAALGALAVAVVFATLGDGVDVSDATGARRRVVEFGHIAVWGLLTVAFATAAIKGRWTRSSGVSAVAAGCIYALFLFAVFLWS